MPWSIARTILRLAVVEPLRYLYVHGPALGGWGFWEGRPQADACAELTAVPASFWASNVEPCSELLDRKFHAGLTLLAVAAYALAAVGTVMYAAVWIGVYLPLRREIRARAPP